MSDPVLFFKVAELPDECQPNAFYYVIRPDGSFDQYLTSAAGVPVPATGGDRNAVKHVQAAAALEWIVNHNLGRDPASVAVVSVGGVEILADVRRVSVNQLRVYFAAPTSGAVLVN